MSSPSIRVATTILDQLGGTHRLKMMIGAHDFLALPLDEDTPNGGVRFGIPGTLSRPRISRIVITLNDGDLYDVQYLLIRSVKGRPTVKEVAVGTDIHCADLRKHIETTTGLALLVPNIVSKGATNG